MIPDGKVLAEITQVTTTVEVIDLLAGNPPTLMTLERGTDTAGNTRCFTQKVAVRDPELFRRLCTESGKGATIQATVVTEWYEDNYASYLGAFNKVVPEVASATASSSTAPLSEKQRAGRAA